MSEIVAFLIGTFWGTAIIDWLTALITAWTTTPAA